MADNLARGGILIRCTGDFVSAYNGVSSVNVMDVCFMAMLLPA